MFGLNLVRFPFVVMALAKGGTVGYDALIYVSECYVDVQKKSPTGI